MPNISDVCARLDTYSDKLSTQVRTLAVGLLAFAGGLIFSVLAATDKAPKVPAWLLHRLFFIGVASLLALAFDLAQYAFMYLYMRSFQKSLDVEIAKKESEDPAFDGCTIEKRYDEKDYRFIAGRFCFAVKIVVLLVAVLWLTVDAYVLLRQGPPS
jgi:hypothetical protein